MLQIRCHRCSWNFTLSQDALATIMEQVEATQAKHHMIDCPKCRHGIKVQTRRLKRAYHPPAAQPADENAAPTQDS